MTDVSRKLKNDISDLRDIAMENGATVAKVVNISDIVFDSRCQFMCRSCKRYGMKATCPPNTPNTDFFRDLISKYDYGLIIGVKYDVKGDTEDIGVKSSLSLHNNLLKLEAQAFKRGYYLTISFIGGSCKLCGTSTCSAPCAQPTRGRIPLEATGVNVIETARKYDVDIKFPVTTNLWRVGLLLVS